MKERTVTKKAISILLAAGIFLSSLPSIPSAAADPGDTPLLYEETAQEAESVEEGPEEVPEAVPAPSEEGEGEEVVPEESAEEAGPEETEDAPAEEPSAPEEVQEEGPEIIESSIPLYIKEGGKVSFKDESGNAFLTASKKDAALRLLAADETEALVEGPLVKISCKGEGFYEGSPAFLCASSDGHLLISEDGETFFLIKEGAFEEAVSPQGDGSLKVFLYRGEDGNDPFLDIAGEKGKSISLSISAEEGYSLNEEGISVPESVSVKKEEDGSFTISAILDESISDSFVMASPVKNAEKEEEEEEAGDTFVYEDDGIKITAITNEKGILPEDAILTCRKYDEKSQEYLDLRYDIVTYLDTTDDRVDVLPYDISFMQGDMEIEPEGGTVSLSFELKDPVKVKKSDDTAVIHVKESGEIETLKTGVEGENRKIDKFEVELDSLSPIVITKTASPSLKSANITTDDGDVWISKTSNIDNNGNASSQYSNNMNVTDVVSIDGAEELSVTITFGGESISYDYLYIKDADGNILYTDADGKTVGSTASSTKGRIGGASTTFTGSSSGSLSHGSSVTYRFETSALQFSWRTDGSATGYGYYAVIVPRFKYEEVPDFHFEELEDGTYALIFDKGGDIDAFFTRDDLKERVAEYKDKVSEIRLNKGTTSVKNGAFGDMPALKTVTMPRNAKLKEIGRNAFAGCDNLERIDIPESVETIRSSAFSGCTSLKEAVFSKDSAMTSLPSSLFKGLTSLEKVVLPPALERVPNSLFEGCSSLKDIDLPDGVKEIGDYAFKGTAIEEVPGIGGLEKIGSYAFENCNGLTDVTIPENVSYISTGAFKGCAGIESFVFEDSSGMKTLPAEMFSGMTSLRKAVLPKGLERLPNNCFKGCKSLKAVEIPDGMTAFGDYAFSGCESLVDFEIPSQVKTLGAYVFEGCTALRDMEIPSTVKSIGSGLFYNCSGLIRASFEDGNGVSSLPSSMFYGCSRLESVKLPDAVTSIPASYFYNCTSLTDVEFPASLTTIGDSAFRNCRALKEIDLPGTLKTIAASAFRDCDSIEEVVIPKSVTSVGSHAFRDCNVLKKASFEDGTTISTLGDSIFYNCQELGSLHLPDTLTAVPNNLCYGCSKLEEVNIPERAKTIGTSAFYGCSSLKDVSLPEGLTSIYSSAFRLTGITGIDLPSTLTSIGDNAFYDTDLKEITIPKKVTSIGSSAFAYNASLEKAVFEKGGSCEIRNNAFSNCKALKEVQMNDSVKTIKSSAFAYSGIREQVIPASVDKIDSYAFNNCSSMEKLEIAYAPSALAISNDQTSGQTFAGLSGLKELVVDRDLTSTRSSTNNFQGISPDVEITIGEHVNTLDNMLVSIFSNSTKVSFKGKNDFTVSDRIDNKSSDRLWSELKGDFYADENGVLYKLDKASSTASLFYVPEGITELTVPETITSVAGKTYTVTGVSSYALSKADDLTSITFEAPENVSLPQFSLAEAKSLALVNGKEEIYPEEWKEVSLLCGFPVHSDKAPQQKISLMDSIDLGEAGDDGTPSKFSFSVTISGQEKMDEDGLTYVYPTGTSARLDFAISNESNLDMSDRVIRVYFAFDGENHLLGNYSPGSDYTLVNTSTGARYPFKVRSTDAKGVYYYDISGFKPGDTLAFNNQFSYMSPQSGGGTMRVWIESITKEEAQEREGKASEPGDYILADWYTKPVPYFVEKEVNGNPRFLFTASRNDEDDDIYVKNLSYVIRLKSTGESGTSYAKDYIRYVDYEDMLVLPEGMVWNEKVIEAVKAGDYYMDANFNVYVKTGGEWVYLCRVGYSGSGSSAPKNLKLLPAVDKNGNEAVKIAWTCINQYWTNTMAAPTADLPALSQTITFGESAIKVKNGSDLWNMLREGEEFTQEESDAMRRITNDVTETSHYCYSEDLTDTASAPDRLVYMETGFSMKKEMTGSNYFGEEHGYRISLMNTGLLHKDDIALVEDTLRLHYYIEPDEMEEMFRDEKWGPFLHIDITSATICNISEKSVVDIYGNEIPHVTAQQSGMDPIPYNGCAPAGSDASEKTANAKISVRWNDERTLLIIDVKDDQGNVQETYTAGEGGDYETLKAALDGIGYIVTYRAVYKVAWDLGDDYALFMAKKDGKEISSLDDLTEEEARKYIYRLKSGRTDVFNILSRVKKTTMWLTEDEPEHYYGTSSISTSNTAYAKREDGTQAGSASWSGHLNRELYLYKSAKADGKTWSSGITVPDKTVIDYTLSFENRGESYDLLPLTDKMAGSQALLLPVRNGKNAIYYEEGKAEGKTLEEAGIDKFTEDGVTYYILDKPGSYKNATIDGRLADTIKVERTPGSVTTLIIWYYQNVTGMTPYSSSTTRSVTYKALADTARYAVRADDENGTSVTSYGIANETWLGGHQTHRLYDSLFGGIEALHFIKWIVEDPESERENLIRHSLVQDGDEVLYKIIIRNTSDSRILLTGDRIHDELPTTSGVFPWSKDNITDIYYVTEGLGSSTTTTGRDYWYVNSDEPGTHADTASRGLYYIYWTEDFKVMFEPQSEFWIYVKTKYPASTDIDEATGQQSNAWDSYITKNNGAMTTNYFYIDERNSNVTHELVDVVEGVLQKGVLDTGITSGVRFQSEGTKYYYQNGSDDMSASSLQNVTYYTLIYNSGNVRLYLDALQDQLPKGFKFRGLVNFIPTAARTDQGFNTESYSSSYQSLGSTVSKTYLDNTEFYSSSRIPVATVKDEERETTAYKRATVRAVVTEMEDGHDQVSFTLGSNSTAAGYLKYDTSLGKYYLDPGEAVRFGYVCAVKGYKGTENIADNEIAMPVFDKYGLGVRASGEDVDVIAEELREVAANDGTCSIHTNDEEVEGRAHTKPAWGKSTTEWFSSNVSLQRLEAVPGIIKSVGGETFIPTGTVIKKDGVYGSRYTDGNKAGTAYTGTVSRTSIVNWGLDIFNEGGPGSNSMEDYWIVDTIDAPYQFTGNVFYDYYSVNGTKITSSSVPVFSLGGRTEGDSVVKISSGAGSSTLTLDQDLVVNGDPVAVDSGRAWVQLLRDESGKETLKIHMENNTHRLPPNTYMKMYLHSQYNSQDAVLSKQFYNHVQLEPSAEFDPALVTKGKVLYREVDGDSIPYAIESGASVTMTAGYTSAARKQVTEIADTSNTGWSDRTKNYIILPEKASTFYYDLYIDLPEDDPTQKLVMIDALPEPDDHSPFVERDMRDSEFFVHLLSEDLGLHVWSAKDMGRGQMTELTTEQFTFDVTQRTEFIPEDWEGDGESWSRIDLGDGVSEEEMALLESARAFRVIIDDPSTVTDPANALMGKNHQVHVRFNAELLYPEKTDPGSIAWNSFGYRYTVPIGATGISTSLNAEPLKVGVMIPSVPYAIKDQKTPLNHYKEAKEDTTYGFLIYTGNAIKALADTSQMTMDDIAGVLQENGRDVLLTSLTIKKGQSFGRTPYLDDERKWAWDGEKYAQTDDHWIWKNGDKYTVMELPFGDNGFVFQNIQKNPVNNYTFTQTVDKNVTLRVTNVYDRKGSLKIEKTVDGPSFDPERKFTFTIHLQDGRYPAYGIYEYKGTGLRDGQLTFDDSGNATIQLKHGQAIEIQGIPEDFTYTVTEADDEWYTCTSKEGDTGTITSAAVSRAAFTNTRQDTSLDISKTVAGNIGSKDKTFDFEVYIIDEGRELTGTFNMETTTAEGEKRASTVTFAEGLATISLSHGERASIKGLPVGARYEVEETEESSKGYDTHMTGGEGVLTKEPALAACTNYRAVGVPTGTTKSLHVYALLIFGAALFFAVERKKKRD